MEVIKNYLESMFADLPNTAEVQKAKSELLQMMEDKYSSLLDEGKKENEAVGIVISEFGNLDEIAETLGISHVKSSPEAKERRHVTKEEAAEFVADSNSHALLIGVGVLLCIISPIFPIIFDSIIPNNFGDAIGAAGLFVSVAIAVGIFIYASSTMKKWDFIKNTLCSIDYQTAEDLHSERKKNMPAKTLCLIIGVILCIVSVIPEIIADSLSLGFVPTEAIATAMLFIMVGIGVMLIIFSTGKDSACTILLGLNDKTTVSGSYKDLRSSGETYSNETVAMIMRVYWYTVTCIYLIWSFLTFDWHITWIIWPVTAMVYFGLKLIFRKED